MKLAVMVGMGWLALCAAAGAQPQAARVAPEAAEFFEKRVRPLLAEKCVSCHGDKVQQAGLRLDSRAAMLKATAAGHPALRPGKPEQSPLIRAVRYDGKIKMPPTGKLAADEIEALEAWVAMGAPWPQAGRAKSAAGAMKKHWAFQPVRKTAPPKKQAARTSNPIDAFLLAKLEAKGLRFSPPADRRALLRRLAYDLTGLPPTQAEVEAFLADNSPNAYEKQVDRLLASPRYGERWGRYWLDVARYADTKGYVYTEERRYPFSYTYRDWVIRAFNADLPYDQFLIQQIAADCLPPGQDKSALAALGFFTLGRRFVNNPPDVIDDRIDTLMRGAQALTVACARCHDHKFDPIPTQDYYSLYGVFAGSTEKTVPLTEKPERTPAFLAYEKELKAREEALHKGLEAKRTELSDRLRRQVVAYLRETPDAEKLPGDNFYIILSPEDVNPLIVRQWKAYIDRTRKAFHPIFAPWHAFAALSEKEFAAKAPALARQFAANADPARRLNPRVAQAFAGSPPASMREVGERYGRLLAEVDTRWLAGVEAAAKEKTPAPAALPDADEEALRRVLYGPDSPPTVPPVRISDIETLFDEGTRNELNALQAKVDQWNITSSEAAPPRALILSELPHQPPPRVFRRGDRRNLGEEAPRRFLALLSGPERRPFQQGSGRLELARAIASKTNPLTARVMVNRIWLHHFGRGLVGTPSDFGARSEPPTHPELLDWLAATFMEQGWSVKKLHRRILLSRAFRQRSDDNPAARRKDPENRLLWRMNRQRLDFEAMRDSLLAVTGQLDLKMGGASVDIVSEPFSGRRAVYGFIDRQNLPGLFRIFDFANPDAHSPQRYVTTVPQQALFLLNSPFLQEGARRLIRRLEMEEEADAAGRIRALYHLVFQREPTARELAIGQRYIATEAARKPEPPALEVSPWQYGVGAVDAQTGRVQAFQPLPHWTGEAWQPGEKHPDPSLGSLRLTATGGEPGQDAQRAVIRRWTAPRDGVVMVGGALKHEAKEGDGVQGRIVSSRAGELGRWQVHNGVAETAVARVEARRGDTLDFLVDCRANPDKDAFAWSPTLRLIEGEAGDGAVEWSADADFSGPVAPPRLLEAWEKYAQALLMANEFIFVD